MECPGFEQELTKLINRTGLDSELNTPDYIIAKVVLLSLSNFKLTTDQRDSWWGFVPKIGNPHIKATEEPGLPLRENYFKDYNSVHDIVVYLADKNSDYHAMTVESANRIIDDAHTRIFTICREAYAHDYSENVVEQPIVPFSRAETVVQVLGELAGAASACWSNLNGAGEFQSEIASTFVEHAEKKIASLCETGRATGYTTVRQDGSSFYEPAQKTQK